MDNKSVIMISSAIGALPLEDVERWHKEERNHKKVPCPDIVRKYNLSMGGVDIFDQLMEYYRTFLKTKKWTLKTILHFMDIGITNSWMEYRIECGRIKVPKKRKIRFIGISFTIG